MNKLWVGMVCMIAAASAGAQQTGVLGRWQEPGGGVIEVHRCGDAVCARLVGISVTAPGKLDAHNPDASLRTRPLCGMEIGQGFHLNDPDHAEDGTLYDPKTGKTYKGAMTFENGRLKLRGYVGIKAFGRSEVWTPAGADAGLGLCSK